MGRTSAKCVEYLTTLPLHVSAFGTRFMTSINDAWTSKASLAKRPEMQLARQQTRVTWTNASSGVHEQVSYICEAGTCSGKESNGRASVRVVFMIHAAQGSQMGWKYGKADSSHCESPRWVGFCTRCDLTDARLR